MVTNLEFCIESMRGSLIASKDALQIELAVGLLVFSSLGAADIAAKKVLRGVYASAGRFDCLKPDSPSYSSVNRYMDRCAGLFERIGARKVTKIVNGKHDADALNALVLALHPMQLMSWDDVAQYATGVPKKEARALKSPSEHARRSTDVPGTIHISTEHIKIDIPPDATHKEIMELVQKLIQVAESAKLAA